MRDLPRGTVTFLFTDIEGSTRLLGCWLVLPFVYVIAIMVGITASYLAVVIQITLGLFGHEAAIWGMLHGINALILFSLAVYAGLRVRNMEQHPVATTAAEREHV